MSLAQELESFVTDFAKRMPPDVVEKLQQSITDLINSGITERALKTGDLAPDFRLPNASGKQIALGDLLQNGPTIVTFYRGVWCPYCNMELRAYQKILPEIRAVGGGLVAISPQTPDNSLSTAEKNALEFEVLSDHRNAVADQFGIAYNVPEIVKAINAKFGRSLPEFNGSDEWRLPISATYVISTNRQIALASVSPDFRVRLEPTEALAALTRLTQREKVA